jgi:hypothetical protein
MDTPFGGQASPCSPAIATHFGTVYAWRERNKTYAVVALPRSDQLVAPLVRALG